MSDTKDPTADLRRQLVANEISTQFIVDMLIDHLVRTGAIDRDELAFAMRAAADEYEEAGGGDAVVRRMREKIDYIAREGAPRRMQH